MRNKRAHRAAQRTGGRDATPILELHVVLDEGAREARHQVEERCHRNVRDEISGVACLRLSCMNKEREPRVEGEDVEVDDEVHIR